MVEALFTVPAGGRPPERRPVVRAVAGAGLEGDRYLAGTGYWSGLDECQVTFIEAESLDHIAATSGVAVGGGEHRRNIVTRGVDLTSLAGRRFRVGEAVFEYDRPRPPCRYIQSVSEPGMTRALGARRGGICARVVQSGEVRPGDVVELVETPTGRRPWPGVPVLARVGAVLALVAASLVWREELSSLVPRTAEGWLRVAVVVAVFVLLTRLLGWLVPSAAVRRLVVLALAAGLVWYAVAPAFRDERVVEPLLSPVETAEPAGPGTAELATVEPGTAQRLTAGPLDGIGHRATGTAAVHRLPDGTHFVRLEDIDVQGAPDVFVYLVPEAGQEEPDGGANLGRLKGNQGSQNYVLPDDVDPDRHRGVLLWCRMFSTPIAAAPLA